MESVKQGDYVRVSVANNGIQIGDVLYGESEEKLEINLCKSVTAPRKRGGNNSPMNSPMM